MLGFWVCACHEVPQTPEPAWDTLPMIHKSELRQNENKSLVLHDEKPFTGIAFSCYPEGDYAEQISYQNGKRSGPLQRWYPNGLLSQYAFYENNKRQGECIAWWDNGLQKSSALFRRDSLHGEVKQWYRTGELFKKLTYQDGKANGMQQAWRQNGVLYANYEIKNGRSYGLRKSNLCFQLEEEEITLSDRSDARSNRPAGL